MTESIYRALVNYSLPKMSLFFYVLFHTRIAATSIIYVIQILVPYSIQGRRALIFQISQILNCKNISITCIPIHRAQYGDYRCMETIKSIFYVHCIIQSSIIKKTVCMQRNCFISYVTYQKGAFKDAIVSAELEPAIMTYPFYLISVFYSLYLCLNVGIGRFTCAFENQIVTTHYNCACFLRANCRLLLLSTVLSR